MTGAALVFWLQFWRLWLREVVGPERERPDAAPALGHSAGVVDLAQWRREHRGAA